MVRRSRRHHYVPQAIQRRFCFKKPNLWYSIEKDGIFTKPEVRNIDSTFQERDYYTVLEDGCPSDVVERKFYGAIDDYLGKLLKQVDQLFETGRTPIFKGRVLADFRRTVFLLLKRTPEFLGEHDDEKIGREITEATIKSIRESGEVIEDEQNLFADLGQPTKLKQLGRDVRVRAQVAHSDTIIEAMSDFDVKWAICERGSFILTSGMMYRIGNGGAHGLINPQMEIWFPISPARCLVMVRDKYDRIPMTNLIPQGKVREINEYGAKRYSQIASHSEKLLLSLISSKS